MKFSIQRVTAGMPIVFLAGLLSGVELFGAAGPQGAEEVGGHTVSLNQVDMHQIIEEIAPCQSKKDWKLRKPCSCRTGKRCRLKASIIKAFMPTLMDDSSALTRLAHVLEQKDDIWEMLQDQDLQDIINALVPLDSSQNRFEKEALYNRLAQVIANNYLLNKSYGKTGYNNGISTPEKLPEFLQSHFKGLSYQDLIDHHLAPDMFVVRGSEGRIQFASLKADGLYINDFSGLDKTSGIEDLLHLDLKNNLLTAFDSKILMLAPNLKILNLGGNRLGTLSVVTFAPAPQSEIVPLDSNLEILLLNDCHITAIAQGTFAGLKRLKEISFRGYNPFARNKEERTRIEAEVSQATGGQAKVSW